jgi:CHAT domain-containing protein/Tfp pilus assembly protein PilF
VFRKSSLTAAVVATLFVLTHTPLSAQWWDLSAQWWDPLYQLNAKSTELLNGGRRDESRDSARQAYEIAIKRPQIDKNVATAISNWSGVMFYQLRFDEASKLGKQALEMFETLRDAEGIATTQGNLADTYRIQGRYSDAEEYYTKSIGIYKSGKVNDNASFALRLHMFGNLRLAQARYKEATDLITRAVELAKITRDSNQIAGALLDLAFTFLATNDYKEADKLFNRALPMFQGPIRDEYLAVAYNNMAEMYMAQGFLSKAQPLLERAGSLRETQPSQRPFRAAVLINLALLYTRQNRYTEAKPFFERALALLEQSLPNDHPKLAGARFQFGSVYLSQGRYAEAERLLQQALSSSEKKLGPGHPQVSPVQNALASTYFYQNRLEESLALVRLTMAQGRADKNISFAVLTEARTRALITDRQALSDSLLILQSAPSSAVALAVERLSIRLAANTGELADLVRKDQQLAAESDHLDNLLIDAVSRPVDQQSPDGESYIRNRITGVKDERARLFALFEKRFPDYAALSNPHPMTVDEIQSYLDTDEALIVFDFAYKSYAWIFTNTFSDWVALRISSGELESQVKDLRSSLTFDEEKPFDTGLAAKIYDETISGFSGILKSKTRISIVANGAFTSLPPQLLISKDPTGKTLGQVSWLIQSHAITVLPSIPTLRILREAKRPSADKTMIAFANPIFQRKRDAKPAAVRAVTTVFRGGQVDPSRLAAALPQLPSTDEEVKEIARILNVPRSDLKLGEAASEATVKRSKLSDYKIVYFATHGLISGEVQQFLRTKAEPALALTIPRTSSDFDDGLLTSSEIAELNLNSDWIILAACNTAAEGKPGAEALSGLARSFFYAGARSLVVSHWRVESGPTVRLMVGMFQALSDDPTLSHAEAQRQSILKWLDNGSARDSDLHPRMWAPFIVVGEPRKHM